MLEDLSNLVLSFTWERPILWMSGFGLVLFSRKIAVFKALILMSLSVFVSFSLKVLFGCLASSEASIANFPSTQTTIAVCFFGYVALAYKKHPFVAIPCLLMIASVATSLVILGYHISFDIMAALVTGGTMLFLMSHFSDGWESRMQLIVLTGSFLAAALILWCSVPNALKTNYFMPPLGILLGSFLYLLGYTTKLISENENFVLQAVSRLFAIFFSIVLSEILFEYCCASICSFEIFKYTFFAFLILKLSLIEKRKIYEKTY